MGECLVGDGVDYEDEEGTLTQLRPVIVDVVAQVGLRQSYQPTWDGKRSDDAPGQALRPRSRWNACETSPFRKGSGSMRSSMFR